MKDESRQTSLRKSILRDERLTNHRAMVIDASTAASWLLPDETVDAPLEALGSSELHAPSLIWAEMRIVLVVLERRKRLTVDTLSEALSILDATVVNFDNAPDGSRVMQLA